MDYNDISISFIYTCICNMCIYNYIYMHNIYIYLIIFDHIRSFVSDQLFHQEMIIRKSINMDLGYPSPHRLIASSSSASGRQTWRAGKILESEEHIGKSENPYSLCSWKIWKTHKWGIFQLAMFDLRMIF